MAFLPITKEEAKQQGIDVFDFIFVTADAYIDHPSFGVSILTRLIESEGFTVGIISQPKTDADFTIFGLPKFAFLVSSGVVDSMVNNYTVAKKKREVDVYSEGGKYGNRPDRALEKYCQSIRRIYGSEATILIGGIEASLRRFSHYDYWSDSVMRSILIDTDADLLSFGMGEYQMIELLKYAKKGIPLKNVKDIYGTAFASTYDNLSKKLKNKINDQSEFLCVPSHESVCADKIKYIDAFNLVEKNTDFLNAKALYQKCGNIYVVQNKPAPRLEQKVLDFIYSLPYERKPHPIYTKGVPAITEVEFSVNSHRGCYGNCSFCALCFHQGRAVQARSEQSILNEVKHLTTLKDFKGYIHDIGGPSANFFEPACSKQLTSGVCKNNNCIGAKVCPNLKVSHEKYLSVLRKARQIEGVKKVFVRSGVRFDYCMLDKDPSFFNELCKYHISGQLKIAPEHICDNVLTFMNKPSSEVYKAFKQRYDEYNKKIGKKQFLVPYFISSHPGCTLDNAIELAEYLSTLGYMPLQVQDFYPTPSTRSTTAYYTELDPTTKKPIYVAKNPHEKAMQRALLQYRNPKNYNLIKEALIKANRTDLIGNGAHCLIKDNSVRGRIQKSYSQQNIKQKSMKKR